MFSYFTLAFPTFVIWYIYINTCLWGLNIGLHMPRLRDVTSWRKPCLSISTFHNRSIYIPDNYSSVKVQNMPWYKTVFVSRQVLHLLSKLQNWICPQTGQYKTCIVSNTKIEASILATKPKPWKSHLTPETVEIFIQNEKAGLACFGAAGLA